MTAPLIFMDTETTGLSLEDDDIWEFAAVRRDPDGTETEQLHLFIEHDSTRCASLPLLFLEDHLRRYVPHAAEPPNLAAASIVRFVLAAEAAGLKPHVVGAVPNFDTERVTRLLEHHGWRAPRWHHHLIDVENLAVGYLAGLRAAGGGVNGRDADLPALPWSSDDLSLAVGVDPDEFARHTAMGDVRWAMAIYDAVMCGEVR